MQGCASAPRPSHIDGAHLITFGGATFYTPDDAPVYQDSNYELNRAIRTINNLAIEHRVYSSVQYRLAR
jgi:hypothetical protein